MREPSAVRGYLQSAAMVLVATLLTSLGHAWLALPDVAMTYLLVIMAAAARWGRGPSVLASALAVAAYDFFFVTPRFTFAVADPRNLLTFAAMFLIGQLVAGLALRIRQGEREAREREARARALSEEALTATREAEAERSRATLLSAVSHDLRTPLAAITGAATTLRAPGASLDAAERDDLVATICEEAERMERILANLLDMTRIESGALRVRREWVPLEEVVGSALARLDAALAGREVRVHIPPTLPLVSADPVLLEQVFFNLFDNAARHTPGDVPVEVEAAATPRALEVTVSDRGPGLAPGSEERLFERYVRGPHASGGGVGLGLAIARGIVTAHGGTLRAEAREGGGARFVLSLPVTDASPPPPPPVEEAA